MRKLAFVVLLLSALACGVPAVNMEPLDNTPTPVSVNKAVVAPSPSPAPSPTRIVDIVCGVDDTHGGLWVRKSAGVQSPATQLLKNGDVVILTGNKVEIGASIWVQISQGWINAKYTCQEVR